MANHEIRNIEGHFPRKTKGAIDGDLADSIRMVLVVSLALAVICLGVVMLTSVQGV